MKCSMFISNPQVAPNVSAAVWELRTALLASGLQLVSAAILPSLVQSVVVVADGEHGFAAQPDVGHGFIQGGQVELSDFLVAVMDLGFLGPERRIPGGLGIDAGHGKVLGIDPDGSAIEELGFAQRL